MTVPRPDVQQLEARLAAQRAESQTLQAKLEAQRVEIQRMEERRLAVQNIKIGENVAGGEKFAEQRRRAEAQIMQIEVQKRREAQQQLEIQRMEERVKQLEMKRLEAQILEGKASSVNQQQSWAKYAYSDELISGIADWAVKLHQLGGMARLETESRACYENSGNRYRCLYFDLAARRIGAVRTGSANSGANPYFDDANFGYRLTTVFKLDGFDDAAVNSFLRAETARMNVFVVQKINMDGFVN